MFGGDHHLMRALTKGLAALDGTLTKRMDRMEALLSDRLNYMHKENEVLKDQIIQMIRRTDGVLASAKLFIIEQGTALKDALARAAETGDLSEISELVAGMDKQADEVSAAIVANTTVKQNPEVEVGKVDAAGAVNVTADNGKLAENPSDAP